ncbi:MAG: glycosyltransferase family 4 protein [Longimicrobiales bacterium]|nr:glycosyltransferase family 4 protein [Longimicrobiales bacterium]
MRILVVNWLDRENPQAGGAEEHLHETFGRLAANGHDVTALVSGWPGCSRTADLDGIDVHRAGGRHTFSVAGPSYYRRTLAGRGFDVVVEDLNKVPMFAPFWVSAPVVLLAHHLFGTTAFQAASPPIAATTWMLERTIPLVYRRVPCIAVSKSTRADLVGRGLRRELIEVVPNGVDVDVYTPRPEAKTVQPTLLFLGRLKQYKRVDLVIEAVARLAAEGIEVELRVGGAGDQSAVLEALAVRLKVADRVSFLGFVPDDVKLELLQSSWLHVLTSPKEGWGISNIEAAACGIPTIASDAPGLRESVVHERTGLLVPHGDVDALADAIRSLIRDPERRTRMSMDARSFAEGYSWDSSARRVETILSRVVAHSGPE